jgi:hypothetical protein
MDVLARTDEKKALEFGKARIAAAMVEETVGERKAA